MAPDPERRLRVLMVMHMVDSRDLGGARVQLELADELRASGCQVRVLARDEILGGRRQGRLGVSSAAFAAAAVRRVREIAHDYDVIDAHQGNLPVSKRHLNFDGLMVTRSVGLVPLYTEFARTARRRWPNAKRGRFPARELRRWRAWRFMRQTRTTLKLCDLINVANVDEQAYLEEHFGLGKKTVVFGLGIEERRLNDLAGALQGRGPGDRRIAFIGTWTARKGAYDWPDIVARVRRLVPDVSFVFLGTHVGQGELERTLGLTASALTVVPSYTSEQLGSLLGGVRVGALPSYIEGFGIGVVEKMAAGIPSVCYDVPGPRETIGRVAPQLLVPPGDTAAFAERLVELLELDAAAYRELSSRCRSVAKQFSWHVIAAQTLSTYRERLAALRGT
jgi:glycosyltransferase involved in cell wall biosynthesis